MDYNYLLSKRTAVYGVTSYNNVEAKHNVGVDLVRSRRWPRSQVLKEH